MIWLLFIVAAGAAVWVAIRVRKNRHIATLVSARLSEQDRALLLQEVPLLHSLPDDHWLALEGKMTRFLDQVTFIGCDGLEVDAGMELSIAGQACLLIVNSEAWYDTLQTILIYPGAFRSRQIRQEGFVVTEQAQTRIGESWARGPVILSWRDSEQGAQNTQDAHNVVLHEFAHQLDALSGETNAIPVLGRGQSLRSWAQTIDAAFDAHVLKVNAGKRTLIDSYGAGSHEEFFAVAIETFFERPADLFLEEPALYGQLQMLLGLDPKGWA